MKNNNRINNNSINNKNSASFLEVVNNITKTFFTLLSDTFSLAKLEMNLARESLGYIVILSLIGISLLSITWLCVIGIIFLLLVSLHFSVLTALLSITLLNIFLLACIITALIRLRRNLHFPATRRQLRDLNCFKRSD